MTEKQRQILSDLGFGVHGNSKALAKETEISWADKSSCFSWLQVSLLATSKSRKNTCYILLFSLESSISAIFF